MPKQSLDLSHLSIKEGQIGLSGFPEKENLSLEVSGLRAKHKNAILDALKAVGVSRLMQLILTEETDKGGVKDENLIGFVSLSEFEDKEYITGRLDQVAEKICENDQSLNCEEIRKILRILFRDGLRRMGGTKLFHIEGLKKTPDQVVKAFLASKDFTDFLKKLGITGNESASLMEDLNTYAQEAVQLTNKVFEDLVSLNDWLLSNTDANIPSAHFISTYTELAHTSFYEILRQGIRGEKKVNGHFREISELDQYLAQIADYLAYHILKIRENPNFFNGTDKQTQGEIEQSLDDIFWDQVAEDGDVQFIFYRSKDNKKVSMTQTEECSFRVIAREPRKIKNEICDEIDFPTDLKFLISKNNASPKELDSTLLKILNKGDSFENLSDIQRSEAVLQGITIWDLDLNTENPNHARNVQLHASLGGFLRKYGNSQNLTEVRDDTHYTKIKPGQFKIENKAEWDSSKGVPKNPMLAIKIYSCVALDHKNQIIKDYNPENHPDATIIRREFRLLPYDLAHIGSRAESSVLHHKPYKLLRSAELIQMIPKAQFPEIHNWVHSMFDGVKESKKAELEAIFVKSKPNWNQANL